MEELDLVKAFGAPHVLYLLREEIMRRLSSTGGRPALEGVGDRRKIPFTEDDWRMLDRIAKQLSESGRSVAPAQVASAIVHLQLEKLTCVLPPLAVGGKVQPLPLELDETQLGYLEGNIDSLRQVIVMAHQVEAPEDVLREAVIRNFEREVQYLFLVSPSNFKKEQSRYYKFFETLALIVIQDQRPEKYLDDLIKIKPLAYEWIDYPYIFYRTLEKKSKTFFTFGYRGIQGRVGIAKSYVLIDPPLAHTLAQSVLKAIGLADKLLPLEEFIKPIYGVIVPFEPRQNERRQK